MGEEPRGANPPLHTSRLGRGQRIALVHGFTQTSRCWGPAVESLCRDHELVLVDAPGHGGSSGIEVDLVEGGRLIAECAGPGTYVGYSMGGRFVLHSALERPELVRGLVLIGATPGIEDPAERAARIADDEARATRIIEMGVARFLQEWLALPIFAGLPEGAGFVEERLENTAGGLASSLRLAGTGSQQPVWTRLGELDMPTLVVAGAEDEKFAAIGERMARAIGANATFETVPGAGHTAHLEQPDRFWSLLGRWLAQHGL